MCGIAGIVGIAGRDYIQAMTDIQAHRGPDDSGTLVLDDDLVALGHRRLSIIDLTAAGHQPMSSETGEFWITFNGEIYNYREIRNELERRGHSFRSSTDTEVLLAAYAQWGDACLNHLNGMFAFAIYDARRKRLFAARDRLGIKPFYYFYVPGLLVFASEIKALFACPRVPKRPDYAALWTPARFQVSPYTGFEGIRKLPAACSLTFENREIRIDRYWSPIVDEAGQNDSDVIDQLDHLTQDAVRLQMVADVPVGVFLSGGLDSSLVSALMRRETNQEIHAFTIRFSQKDQAFERMPDDSKYARSIAQSLDLRYHELEIRAEEVAQLFSTLVWHVDEPLSDPAAINTYLIAREARARNIVVLLNGMGGDEIFGGYRKHLACLRAEIYQAIAPLMVRRAMEDLVRRLPVATDRRGLRTLRWIKRFASFGSLTPLDRYLASDLALNREQFSDLFQAKMSYGESRYYQEQERVYRQHSDQSYLTRMCWNDTSFFLPDHNLTYSDKATMAVGVESRPPLIDHRIVEFAFRLNGTHRIRGNEQKFILKKVAERYLPDEIIYRPKAPFGAPLRAWIRGPLARTVDDLLSDDNVRSSGLYNPRTVRRLIDADRAGREDNAHVIWTLLTNQLWFRRYFS